MSVIAAYETKRLPIDGANTWNNELVNVRKNEDYVKVDMELGVQIGG